MRSARVFALYFMAIILICLVSCGNSSSQVPVFEQEYPDMVMKSATYTLYKDSSKPITIKADNIEVFSSSKKAVFENAKFYQDENITGSCSKATVIDSERISLSTNVVIEKKNDQAKICCDKLDWNNASGSINASDNIVVSYSDDINIEAGILITNLNENTYRFEKIKETKFKVEDESVISIKCDSLTYDSENEKVLPDGKVIIDDSKRKASITGAKLVYEKNESLITLSLQTQLKKETNNGLLTCTSETMVYNTKKQTVTIMGNAHIVWNNDSYKASVIIVDLNTDKITLYGPVSGVING